MGYCVEMEMQGVVIPGVKVPGAITALEKLMNATRTTMDAGTIRRHYGWVDTDGVLKALKHGNLVAALSEWRYNAEEGDRMTPVEQLACGRPTVTSLSTTSRGGSGAMTPCSGVLSRPSWPQVPPSRCTERIEQPGGTSSRGRSASRKNTEPSCGSSHD